MFGRKKKIKTPMTLVETNPIKIYEPMPPMEDHIARKAARRVARLERLYDVYSRLQGENKQDDDYGKDIKREITRLENTL